MLKVTNYRGVLERLLPHPKSIFSTFLSYFQCFYEEQFNRISALEERLARGVHLYPHLKPPVWWLASSNSDRTLSSLDLWHRPLWCARTLVRRRCYNVATSNKSVCSQQSMVPVLSYHTLTSTAGQLVKPSNAYAEPSFFKWVTLVHLAATLWLWYPPRGPIFTESCAL